MRFPTKLLSFSAAALPVLYVVLLALLSGCAGKLSYQDMSQGLWSGSLDSLIEEANSSYSPGADFQASLTLARLYQMNEQWDLSRNMYDDALAILVDYESRAVHNIRAMASQVGVFTLSRASQGYFGAGYERTLLHTFNAFNYIMLGDISGAAVEMRKMEERQKYWLEEAQALKTRLEEQYKGREVHAAELPAGYSMRDILRAEEGRRLVSSYQDAFSYTLSSLVCALAGDTQFSDVSAKRAIALAPEAHVLLRNRPEKAGNPARQKKTGRQDIIFVTTSGIAPSLYIQRVRIPVPYIGYIVLDMPAYKPPVDTSQVPKIIPEGAKTVPAIKLLHTDVLAYRTLLDQARYEATAAYIRAGVKAAAATAAYAVARSHDDLRPYSDLIATAVTAIEDLSTSIFDSSVRNWDTLPASGYVARTTVPSGSDIRVAAGGMTKDITLPQDGSTVFIWVSCTTPNQMRVSYVSF